MKNLIQFLTEASLAPKAKEQARKMNLKSDGHGGWLNARGEFVAKTEGQRLKFSIRTNKTGTSHKLGQYINLAVKFNGISK